jgi:hypothetical protein
MLVPWSIRNRPGLWKDFTFSLAYATSGRGDDAGKTG